MALLSGLRGHASEVDADAELCLWLRGQAEPLKQEFRCGDDVHGLHRVLAQHVLK